MSRKETFNQFEQLYFKTEGDERVVMWNQFTESIDDDYLEMLIEIDSAHSLFCLGFFEKI